MFRAGAAQPESPQSSVPENGSRAGAVLGSSHTFSPRQPGGASGAMSTIIAPTDVSLDLYTLDEIAARTRIEGAVLRRLGSEHSGRVPTAGDDPLRRYPPAAVDAFRRLAREDEEGGAAASWHRRPLLSLTAQLRAARREPEGGREAPPPSQSAEAASAAAAAAGRRWAQAQETAEDSGARAPRREVEDGVERGGRGLRPDSAKTQRRPGGAPAAAAGDDGRGTASAVDPVLTGAPAAVVVAAEVAAVATACEPQWMELATALPLAPDAPLANASPPAPDALLATVIPPAPEAPRRLWQAAPDHRPQRGAFSTAAQAPVATSSARASSAAGVTARLAALEASQRRLEAEICDALAALREPLRGSVAEI